MELISGITIVVSGLIVGGLAAMSVFKHTKNKKLIASARARADLRIKERRADLRQQHIDFGQVEYKLPSYSVNTTDNYDPCGNLTSKQEEIINCIFTGSGQPTTKKPLFEQTETACISNL